jgi:outer membrane protein assembly factor BamE (lipoprotein component of BamABCDE complex)
MTILLLLCAMILQTGCVMLPIPTTERMLAGIEVTQEQLAFLVPKVTTKEEVIEHLGSPNVIWEDAQVFSYDWVVRQGVLVWMVGSYGAATGGIEDIPKRYSFLIQFDEHGRVQRFEKVVRPALKPYGDFLKEWVREHDKTIPSTAVEK